MPYKSSQFQDVAGSGSGSSFSRSTSPMMAHYRRSLAPVLLPTGCLSPFRMPHGTAWRAHAHRILTIARDVRAGIAGSTVPDGARGTALICGGRPPSLRHRGHGPPGVVTRASRPPRGQQARDGGSRAAPITAHAEMSTSSVRIHVHELEYSLTLPALADDRVRPFTIFPIGNQIADYVRRPVAL